MNLHHPLRKGPVALALATLLPWLPPALLGATSNAVSAATAHYSFAGLSLTTTEADLRERYPNSTFQSNHVFVSVSDAHDEISSVAVPWAGGSALLRIGFGREIGASSPRRFDYPRCGTVLDRLTADFGAPNEIVDYAEEQMQVRRHKWQAKAEALFLLCFVGDDHLYAEAISISPSLASAGGEASHRR